MSESVSEWVSEWVLHDCEWVSEWVSVTWLWVSGWVSEWVGEDTIAFAFLRAQFLGARDYGFLKRTEKIWINESIVRMY